LAASFFSLHTLARALISSHGHEQPCPSSLLPSPSSSFCTAEKEEEEEEEEEEEAAREERRRRWTRTSAYRRMGEVKCV